MVSVDLITGFLGAGKTTFIHKYIHFLKRQGLSVRIIENEFGDVGVDTELLKDEGCEIQDLSGLCMCCVGKKEFIAMLKQSAIEGCDRIVVEPSGIYDVDEFFEVLALPEIQNLCEIGSIITIADPQGMDNLSAEAKYLTFAQFLASGVIIVSKTQLISDSELESALEKMNGIMVEGGCAGGILADVCTKSWDDLSDSDFEDFCDAGYARFVHDRELFNHAAVFQSVLLNKAFVDENDLKNSLKQIFAEEKCGLIYRIKGFAKDQNGLVYEVNSTKDVESVKLIDIEKSGSLFKQDSLVLIGQDVSFKAIRNLGFKVVLQ